MGYSHRTVLEKHDSAIDVGLSPRLTEEVSFELSQISLVCIYAMTFPPRQCCAAFYQTEDVFWLWVQCAVHFTVADD